MLIDYDMLIAYGGFARKYDKGSIIFREGDIPYFYYQVLEGEVKLFSTNADGKDLMQGFFKSGDSFGEPPLLLGRVYPSTAQACTASIIVKISKERLLSIMKDFPAITEKLLYAFARRIYDKATSVQIWVNQTPEDKIKSLFKKLKSEKGTKGPMLVPYTRQQIADITGLRVETVIRTLIRMSTEKKIDIIDHKVYY
ncbi:MAG: Crp/Fnr family transcriptional regulator [Chitinophagaceae bacterium]|nr:Crp/Fnr family transcriptional regulator [Chitinophagaceae bacterium]MCW5929036.1 Crp/Fnr family transcriptional regulator [Chitinophagaceae bacterium]